MLDKGVVIYSAAYLRIGCVLLVSLQEELVGGGEDGLVVDPQRSSLTHAFNTSEVRYVHVGL